MSLIHDEPVKFLCFIPPEEVDLALPLLSLSLSLTRLQFSIQWSACAHPRPIINRIHSPGFYTCGDATSSDSAQYTRMAKTQRLYYRNNEARSPFITIDNEFDIGGHPFLFRNPAGFSAVELGAGKKRRRKKKEEKLMTVMNNSWPSGRGGGEGDGDGGGGFVSCLMHSHS